LSPNLSDEDVQDVIEATRKLLMFYRKES